MSFLVKQKGDATDERSEKFFVAMVGVLASSWLTEKKKRRSTGSRWKGPSCGI